MLYFRNDYGAGAHPAVLEALCQTNMDLTPGYGTDKYTRQAEETIRDLCGVPDAAVHFLMGGTQVNKTAIAAFLRPYEAVLAADSGHICVHEAGAVEQDGHAVLRLPAPDGKLTPELLRSAMAGPVNEHTVVPRLAYISNTTELGTVYTRSELLALRRCCDELGLYLTTHAQDQEALELYWSYVKLLKEGMWDLATCANGEPNVVPVAFKDVTADGKLVVGDVFLETTLKNIRENGGRIAISVYDAKTLEGYQLKGVAEYVTTGAVVDAFKAMVEKVFNGAATARGALVITPERVIVTTPGADNKKVL